MANPKFAILFFMSMRIVIMKNAAWVGLAVALIAIAPGLKAQEIVVLQRNSGGVWLDVPARTTLEQVLTVFCKQTRTECQGIELAKGVTVPSEVVQGTWAEVVDKLLEGAQLNYLAAASSPSQTAQLILQQRTEAPPDRITQLAASAASAVTAETQAEPIPEQAFAVQSSSENSSTSSSPELWGSSAGSSSGAGNAGSNNVGMASTGIAGSPFTSEMLSQNSGERERVFPFPDNNGHVIVLPPSQQEYLPFPGGNGQLIPMPQTSGSPFPVTVHSSPL